MQSTELSYRKSAAQGASGFGMMIVLYDTLAGDLRRAAEAERRDDLEKRCLEVNHALMVIGFLEDAMERADRGELTKQLVSLYSSLRCKLIQAQAKRSPQILEEQMERVLLLRESWQKMDLSMPETQDALSDLAIQDGYQNQPAPLDAHTTSWSA